MRVDGQADVFLRLNRLFVSRQQLSSLSQRKKIYQDLFTHNSCPVGFDLVMINVDKSDTYTRLKS